MMPGKVFSTQALACSNTEWGGKEEPGSWSSPIKSPEHLTLLPLGKMPEALKV